MTEHRTQTLATKDNPYHFLESGLSNIYLIGIRVLTYEDGKVVPEILALKQLLQLIARDLIWKPTALTGEEIKFLRKRLGKKQFELAREIGLEPETLSRSENGHQQLSESNDKFIRLYYAFSALDDAHLNELRKELSQLLSQWRVSGEGTVKNKRFAKVMNEEWVLSAA